MNKDKDKMTIQELEELMKNSPGEKESYIVNPQLCYEDKECPECPECKGEKLNIINLKDRQVDLYDIDPDIAEIMPKIVDELLFGKQPEAPENIFMTYTGYDYGAWTTDKDLPGSDIEYIRKDKAAVCGNCDSYRATLQNREFCHITGDFPSERICEKWELRK